MPAFRSGWTRLFATLALSMLALLIASLPVGPWLIREEPLERPDAILVLGSHESERLPHAARLARQWPEADVLLTQPVIATPFNCQDCAHRGQVLAKAGVAGKRVRILAPRVRTTFDEMRVAASWVAASGRSRLLVVTSPYHTRRVRALARALLPGESVGISACPVPDGLGQPWWSRRYDRRYVIYEVAALVNNAWRHGISPRLWLVS